METIEQRMIRLVRDHMCVEETRNAVTPETTFIDDLGADSLDLVQIVMAAEEEFGIEIFDGEAEKLFTVSDAVKFVTQKSTAVSPDQRQRIGPRYV